MKTLNFEGIYKDMSPQEALRYLSKRYIKKEDCKEMLNKIALYIENDKDQ